MLPILDAPIPGARKRRNVGAAWLVTGLLARRRRYGVREMVAGRQANIAEGTKNRSPLAK